MILNHKAALIFVTVLHLLVQVSGSSRRKSIWRNKKKTSAITNNQSGQGETHKFDALRDLVRSKRFLYVPNRRHFPIPRRPSNKAFKYQDESDPTGFSPNSQDDFKTLFFSEDYEPKYPNSMQSETTDSGAGNGFLGRSSSMNSGPVSGAYSKKRPFGRSKVIMEGYPEERKRLHNSFDALLETMSAEAASVEQDASYEDDHRPKIEHPSVKEVHSFFKLLDRHFNPATSVSD